MQCVPNILSVEKTTNLQNVNTTQYFRFNSAFDIGETKATKFINFFPFLRINLKLLLQDATYLAFGDVKFIHTIILG